MSDPDKRGRYDRYGLSAVKGESSSGFGDIPFGGESLFSQFFGGDMFGGCKSLFLFEFLDYYWWLFWFLMFLCCLCCL